MSIFASTLTDWPQLAAELEMRALLESPAYDAATALNPETLVVDYDGPVTFERLVRVWPSRDVAQDLQDDMNGRDMERAAEPVVVSPPSNSRVVILRTRAAGEAADVTGKFRAVRSELAKFVDSTVGAPPRRKPGRVLSVTRRLRRRLHLEKLLGSAP
jgi:hypothetical protein